MKLILSSIIQVIVFGSFGLLLIGLALFMITLKHRTNDVAKKMDTMNETLNAIKNALVKDQSETTKEPRTHV